ncbi:hypothetical protein M758_4G021400 [Ceratodon purpureus]|nr:hypothetical protein M758_4G021400 [Ceratodon purpureus]
MVQVREVTCFNQGSTSKPCDGERLTPPAGQQCQSFCFTLGSYDVGRGSFHASLFAQSRTWVCETLCRRAVRLSYVVGTEDLLFRDEVLARTITGSSDPALITGFSGRFGKLIRYSMCAMHHWQSTMIFYSANRVASRKRTLGLRVYVCVRRL